MRLSRFCRLAKERVGTVDEERIAQRKRHRNRPKCRPWRDRAAGNSPKISGQRSNICGALGASSGAGWPAAGFGFAGISLAGVSASFGGNSTGVSLAFGAGGLVLCGTSSTEAAKGGNCRLYRRCGGRGCRSLNSNTYRIAAAVPIDRSAKSSASVGIVQRGIAKFDHRHFRREAFGRRPLPSAPSLPVTPTAHTGWRRGEALSPAFAV